jgi:hypothetical protein
VPAPALQALGLASSAVQGRGRATPGARMAQSGTEPDGRASDSQGEQSQSPKGAGAGTGSVVLCSGNGTQPDAGIEFARAKPGRRVLGEGACACACAGACPLVDRCAAITKETRLLSSPHTATHRIAPHCTAPRLTSPHLTSPHLTTAPCPHHRCAPACRTRCTPHSTASQPPRLLRTNRPIPILPAPTPAASAHSVHIAAPRSFSNRTKPADPRRRRLCALSAHRACAPNPSQPSSDSR